MKKKILSFVAILALGSSALLAEDFSDARETHEFEAPQDTSNHWQIRLGLASISGTYQIENAYGAVTSDRDITGGSGFEISFVSGKRFVEGWDYRSVLTIQSNTWENYVGNEVYDTMYLGEGEIAYNINEYFSPFFGFYGGIGITDASQSWPGYDDEAQLTYDLGFFVGASGDIAGGLGYYAKYNFASMKGFNVDYDTYGYRMSPTTLRMGVSYTF